MMDRGRTTTLEGMDGRDVFLNGPVLREQKWFQGSCNQFQGADTSFQCGSTEFRMGIKVDGEMFYSEQNLQKDDTDLLSIFEHIEDREKFLIDRLRDFVEFPTVSADPWRKENFFNMADFMVKILKKFGIKCTVMNVVQTEEKAESTPEVPLILAETEIVPEKRTVLFYCHYDVNPINYHECWSDPFELRLASDGSELIGKGTSAAKGPLLCVINAIGAYNKLKIPLPVNVRILIDPFGTVDRDTTGKYLKTIVTDFFNNINSVCLCTGLWLGTVRPCVSHGSRGICYFTVSIEGPSKDLHSGSFGGVFIEPIADLIYILNGLVDKNGIIRITDIYRDVAPVTKEEKKYLKTVHFSVRDLQQEIGTERLHVNEDKAAILMRLWRQPSLTIHGIQGAFSGTGTKNVIPRKVIGKFSINIVPNMTPTVVKKRVVDYLRKVWKSRKSTNKIFIQMTEAKLHWLTDASDLNVIAAKGAVAKVYNTEPDLIRQPQRVRMANVLKKLTHSQVVSIPIGKCNDVCDSHSEKLDVTNYINGAKIFAAYMTYLAELLPSVPIPTAICTCKLTGELDSCECHSQYGPPPEEESYELMDKSLSQEMIVDEKPDARYYYLSMLAMKRMQKLQEVISLSHLFHSSPLHQKPQEPKEKSGSAINSRAALESFSVSDIHDLSKPRTGGWLPRPSAAKMESSSTPEVTHQSAPVHASVEGSPLKEEDLQHTQPSLVVEPTLFSFSTVRIAATVGMRVGREVRGEAVKKVITITAETLAKKKAKDMVKSAVSSRLSPLKRTSLVRVCRSKAKPEVSQLQGTQSAVLKARSNQGVKSIGETLTYSSSSVRSRPAGISTPGDPISSFEIVSSLSRRLYEKRLRKHRTDSVRVVKSGLVHETSSESTHSKRLSNQYAPPNNRILETNAEIFVGDSGSLKGSEMLGDSMVDNLANISTQPLAQRGEVSEDEMKAEFYANKE